MCAGASRTTGADEPGAPIEALRLAVTLYSARRRDGRGVQEVADELVALRHLIDLLELEFARDTVPLGEPGVAGAFGSTHVDALVRHTCRMSSAAASRAVNVGAAEPLMPESVAAVVDGSIGYGHLTLMAGTALEIGDPQTPGSFPEEALLGLAREHSVSRFQFDCTHARHAHDAERFLDKQVEDEVNLRRLEITRIGDGRVAINGIVDRAAGAAIRATLGPLARRSGPDDHRPVHRRYADAFVELCQHGLDSGVVPDRAGQRTHLHVTTTLETLQGLAGAPAGELELSLPIAAATVQRLACDSDVVRILLGADSQVLDVGRALRVPNPAIRRALAVRDRGCVWPHCERPPSWTQAHHIQHWARHRGGTDRDNLVLLCWRHHEMVHEGGWSIVRSVDGQVTVTPPRVPVFTDGRSSWPRAPARRGAA